MARPSEWISKIPSALAILDDFPAPLFDRAALAELLLVSQRSATRILHRLGAVRLGGALVLERRILRERLEMLLAGREFELVSGRRQRVEETVRQAAAVLRTRKVVLQPPGGAEALPSTLRLGHGLLQIEFRDAADLLSQLYALVQVAATDYEHFEQMMDRSNR